MSISSANPTVATYTRYVYTATGGETSISGADSNGLILAYTIGKEQVFLNGTLLVRGSDYTATTGTSITGLTALVASDIVEILIFTSFSITDAVVQTLVDAKGDLLVGSADNAISRLAVGNSGETLVADSSTTTGLRYQGNQAAGRNIVINGGMDIWQRGTSSSSLGNYHTADRWYQGAWSGTGTWARETSVVPSGSQYSAKFTASTTAQPYFIQAIETANAIGLANQTVTLSAQLATSSSTNVNLVLQHSSNTDEGVTGTFTTATLVSASSIVTTTGTMTRKSVTYSLPSTARTLRIIIETASTLASSAILYIGQVQLELGSVATPFTRAGGTLAGELAACQRYYQRINSADAVYAQMSVFSPAGATTKIDFAVQPFVPMRIAPTSLEYSTLTISDNAALTAATGTFALTTSNSRFGINFSYTHGTAVFTQYRNYCILANNSLTAYLGFSAEL